MRFNVGFDFNELDDLDEHDAVIKEKQKSTHKYSPEEQIIRWRLCERGINFDNEITIHNGARICVTGTHEARRRNNLYAWLIENSFHVDSHVTRNTDVLLVGNNPGETKRRFAHRYGVKEIDINEFISTVGANRESVY